MNRWIWSGHIALAAALAVLGIMCQGDPSPAQPPAPLRAAPGASRVETAAASRPHARDRGLFSELDPQVTVTVPPWLGPHPAHVLRHGEDLYFVVGDTAIAPLASTAAPAIDVSEWGADDADDDGIPNVVDVVLGAKKTVVNGARYEGGYARLSYPGGDVDRHIGVCTDVVVRAFRNAGLDLQRLLYEDIGRRPAAFPMVKKRNRNIDHRRVKTLLPYFEGHLRALDPDSSGSLAGWLPGDVVFMDTLGDPRPDHIGIVSDTLGNSGRPLIINNWTDGYETSEMDLLASVPVTHRFRLRTAATGIPNAARGLEALARRAGITLPSAANQVVVVTTDSWSAPTGWLRRYQRRETTWKPQGQAIKVAVGSAGLARGRGLHDPTALSLGTDKVEGDRRSPAGLFRLGTSFSPRPERWRWPFRQTHPGDRWVDDPHSPLYNTWQGTPGDWTSAEALDAYRLGLVVAHNTQPTVPGAGSAIFLHVGDPSTPTLGCTAMAEGPLRVLLKWLDPRNAPVLLQLPGHLY